MKGDKFYLSAYFTRFEALEDDICELSKAYNELEDLQGVLKARELLSNELNIKRSELSKLKNIHVEEI